MSIPQYVKNAQNKYNAKFDIIQLKLPKGTKGRIKNLCGDMSMSEYCKCAVLERIEQDSGEG